MTYDPSNPTAPPLPDEPKSRMTSWANISTHDLIRSYAYHRGVGVSEVVEEAMREWVERTAQRTLRGYNPNTDEFLETRLGEWFPPLSPDAVIRRGRRPKQ